jgi:ABC-type molybdate transport system substrate-binding protein
VQYRLACVTLCLVIAIHHVEAAETVRLFAAGSLRTAMTDIARAFTTQYGVMATCRVYPRPRRTADSDPARFYQRRFAV